MLSTAIVAISHLFIILVHVPAFFFLSSMEVSRSSFACKRVHTRAILGLKLAFNLLTTCPAELKSCLFLADMSCTASNHLATLLNTGSCLFWACHHSRMGVFADLIRPLYTSHSSLCSMDGALNYSTPSVFCHCCSRSGTLSSAVSPARSCTYYLHHCDCILFYLLT